MITRKHHMLLYLIEFLIIGMGFAFLLTFPMAFYSQLAAVTIILCVYVVIGLLHHRTHHDIGINVVLEYILISAIIFATFIFLNISKL